MVIAHSTARITVVGKRSIDTIGRVTIGREVRTATGQVIEVPDDPEMSKLHACVEVVDGGAMAIDLGSTNGTFLITANGRTPVPRDHWVLVPVGSQLEIGNHRVSVDVFRHPAESYTPSPMPPPSGGARGETRGRMVAGAIGVVVLLAIVAAGLLVVAGRDDGSTTEELADRDEPTDRDEASGADDVLTPRVGDGRLGESARPTADERPTLADGPVVARWTRTTVGAATQTAAVVGDQVYVTTIEAGRAITVGLERADGTERWSSVLMESADEVDSVGAVDAVVFIEVCDADCRLFALDADGTQLWSAPVRENGAVVANSRLYVLTDVGAELIDPRSGDVVRSVAADFVTLERPRPVAIVDLVVDGAQRGEFTVYDFDLRPVFGPVQFDPEELVVGDLNGASVVLAENGELRYQELRSQEGQPEEGQPEEGRPEDDARVVAIDAGWVPLQVIAVEPELVVVETLGGSIHGLDTSGEVAVELWQRPSSVGLDDVVDTDAGPVLVTGDAGDGAEFLDARTGDVRVRVSSGLVTQRMTFGRNALGVVSYDFGPDTSEVLIADWSTGEELLRQEFDGLAEVVDGGVISSTAGEIVYYD